MRNFLLNARQKIITNMKALLNDAVLLYEQGRFSRATFCAMTAIEETGKLWLLSLVSFGLWLHSNQAKANATTLKTGPLQRMIRDHTGKALNMAVSTLYINAGADRRQGQHPRSGVYRTSGIVLLCRSKEWMKWRNRCCYADIDFKGKTSSTPNEVIDKATAYYFICMAYEGVAESGEMGYGSYFDEVDSALGTEFWLRTIDELKQFTKRNREVNVDNLDFLANPERYRKLAEKIEKQTKP